MVDIVIGEFDRAEFWLMLKYVSNHTISKCSTFGPVSLEFSGTDSFLKTCCVNLKSILKCYIKLLFKKETAQKFVTVTAML